MSIPVITFFNVKGGVGTTSLVYHVAWMLSLLGKRVLALDLDPQAELTTSFLAPNNLQALWGPDLSSSPTTIYRSVQQITEHRSILTRLTVPIAERLQLIPGDLALAGLEDFFSQGWAKVADGGSAHALQIQTAFWSVAQEAALQASAEVVLVDAGPTLGAINRSALICSDFLVIPLAADVFSFQSLQAMGPTLQRWRLEWQEVVGKSAVSASEIPSGKMQPAGYVLRQPGFRLDHPGQAYDGWLDFIPDAYRRFVLSQPAEKISPVDNPECLAIIKPYRSLLTIADELKKPTFLLTPADGAIGSHATAAQHSYRDFRQLALKIWERCGLAGDPLQP